MNLARGNPIDVHADDVASAHTTARMQWRA
jgi:hypothetical protein